MDGFIGFWRQAGAKITTLEEIRGCRRPDRAHGDQKHPRRDYGRAPEIVQELRRRLDARDQQVVARAGAGDVEQVPLGVVDLLQVGVVADGLDALLQRNDLVVAGHHDDGAELQPLGQVHRADRDVPARRLDVLVEHA